MRQITKPRLPVRVSLTVLSAAALVACDHAINTVRVEPGTAPLHPVFVLADSTGRGRSGLVYGLSVVPCGSDSVMWQLGATGSQGPPQRLTYGEAPDGFVSLIGPRELRRGCYDVFVTDGRRARFRVDAQGRVTPEGGERHDSSLHDDGPGHVGAVHGAVVRVRPRRAEAS